MGAFQMPCNPELHRHKSPIPTSVYTPGPGELQRRSTAGLDLPGGSQALGSGQPRWTGRARGDPDTHGTHKEGSQHSPGGQALLAGLGRSAQGYWVAAVQG